jgi:hypothetical protein
MGKEGCKALFSSFPFHSAPTPVSHLSCPEFKGGQHVDRTHNFARAVFARFSHFLVKLVGRGALFLQEISQQGLEQGAEFLVEPLAIG